MQFNIDKKSKAKRPLTIEELTLRVNIITVGVVAALVTAVIAAAWIDTVRDTSDQQTAIIKQQTSIIESLFSAVEAAGVSKDAIRETQIDQQRQIKRLYELHLWPNSHTGKEKPHEPPND